MKAAGRAFLTIDGTVEQWHTDGKRQPASGWNDEAGGGYELAASEGLGRIDWAAGRTGARPHSRLRPLLGASLPQACDASSIYPEGFAFCPECGQPLSAWPGARTPPDWWGAWADPLLPRHVPHGLPVTSLALGDSLEERPAAPAVGRFDACCRCRRMPIACSPRPASAFRNSACWRWRRVAACCSTGIRWPKPGMCWCRRG
jgi:hypothetical protein